MNQLDGLLILCLLPLALLLCGYWLAALLPENSAADRLAFALLFGLGLTLAAVAAVNFAHPLAGAWAFACLLPGLPSLLPRNLAALGRDVAAVWRAGAARVALVALAYLLILLWPVMRAPASLFYDGTSNHDSFFWITGAEHLKRHSYLELPARTPTQPLYATAAAIVGWKPDWGRMGAEGLLALASSLIGVSAIKLYLYATASLYFAWLAGGWLALKTFVTDRPGWPAALALAGLQPLFAFFYGNSNLPNLLGALTGAAFVIAFERALRGPATGRSERAAYLGLVALSFHGLLCAYPEMVPFVLLPAGLLWLRHGFTAGWRPARVSCLLAAGAVVLGTALNPVTAVRAGHGFLASFGMARADQNWANLFNPLELAEYAPALASLSVTGARLLGPFLGWPLTAVFVFALGALLLRARDRFGLLAIFAGSGALLLYTVVTGFAYGWQKTVQFSGVFFGMACSAAVVHALATGTARGPAGRWATRLGLAALPAFMVFATAMNFRETYKWSDRKVISADWFALRDLSYTSLRDRPVLVEAGSFPMAFFHGMWSAYFLTESHLYFGARGDESGGYLRGEVVNEAQHPIPEPAAVLVGRRWAETFDADSPRLFTGREFVLLARANRILHLGGVFPLNGPPAVASEHLEFTIRPVAMSALRFVLTPEPGAQPAPDTAWEIHRRTDNGREYTARVEGAAPWSIEVPLVAGMRQTVEIRRTGGDRPVPGYPFLLSQLRISANPVPFSPENGRMDFTREGGWEEYQVSGLAAAGAAGVLAATTGSELWFVASPTRTDVALELIAEPRGQAGAPTGPIQTELWFNDTLLFSGQFSEPGVLRTRILAELWNHQHLARIRLRFPGATDGKTQLRLKSLTTRLATTPRP